MTIIAPLPWSVRVVEYDRREDVSIEVIAADGSLVVQTIMREVATEGDRFAEDDANARYVVTAVNCFATLLSALKEAREAIAPKDLGGISLHEWNGRLKQATAVIDLALGPHAPTDAARSTQVHKDSDGVHGRL